MTKKSMEAAGISSSSSSSSSASGPGKRTKTPKEGKVGGGIFSLSTSSTLLYIGAFILPFLAAYLVKKMPPGIFGPPSSDTIKASTARQAKAATSSQASNSTSANVKAKAGGESGKDKDASKLPKFANSEGKPREAEANCVDRYPQCAQFHKQGECTKNPGWMIVNCPKVCNSCELRDPKKRCSREARGVATEAIYQPGDMGAMFRAIETGFAHYGITVLSRDPWVVTFDNFLSDREVDALIATNTEFERSTDTGSKNEFGETGRILSQGRTSSNSWCRGACRTNPDVLNIIKKIEQVTKVPGENYESFQVLKYELGQKYNRHHDYGAGQKELMCGPRILTFFLYLSDVEEGGETAFPELNIAVKPKKGKALLWPSTLDRAPIEKDPRTDHEARPVISGLKYAANAWIRMYNFEMANLWGCTGSFDYI